MADRRGLTHRDAADRGPARASGSGPRGAGQATPPGRPGGPRSVGSEAGLVAGGLAPFPAEREAGQPSASRAGRGADRLSDRELAVLSYLPTMLTTAEIAAELYVSVNTVKTHLKSIYRKLDVARRRDAVHRARALHLL
jgi:LuxR family maltose regulon positive regulatory protein